ncbi:MAG: M10 family metallopeptidase C-terminal domain-containing protein [Synechococcus sp.]
MPFCQTIWDASGNDTIRLINFNKGPKLNLSTGELSTLSFDVEDKRWSNKMHGNLGIAFDCIIENAIGGSGPDVINGNQSDNQLDGQAGDEILNGSLGIDGIRARTSFKSNQGRATQ